MSGRPVERWAFIPRARRYGLVAGYAAPPQPQRPAPAPERYLDVDHPGQLDQLDCFCIGRLAGTKGTVWQYTAIDVASAYTWATLQVTRRNPSAQWTSALSRTVAADLASRGWRLERVMSDNAQEFRSAVFRATITKLGARHSFIRAGRPQTNGCVERVQQTILDECWKPAFARYLIPKQTGLRLDLERYLRYYNTERAHTGRWTRGRTPDEVLGKAKLWQRNR
jgi:transposase InsO family protein